ncbi:MAG: DUF3127 domain-containing protein [Bacteroidia bacterium]|jgi:hypothetical protein|nr:DUF3127 domain-containing protein [Bacteroidales bacterium]MDD3299593.1 DUF3127 domain-containing protein [Bacteroidales bacterium]MDD3844273.1 DUF3127 domain-containing protein [Bacteroidales bacterium]MDD4617650.1 DUF3127 domain-containing protein [Bacteroidales bacterium]NCC46965.1 DUF3127 domain-containing protein [Bacteroidia bacterium]
MALEITGSLIQKLPVQSGTSARGDWQKQEFVIETNDTYPKKVCFNVWGQEKVEDLTKYAEGEVVKISFNVESREFNSRWYTDLRAWKIEKLSDTQSDIPPVAPGIPDMPDFPDDSSESDLPF